MRWDAEDQTRFSLLSRIDSPQLQVRVFTSVKLPANIFQAYIKMRITYKYTREPSSDMYNMHWGWQRRKSGRGGISRICKWYHFVCDMTRCPSTMPSICALLSLRFAGLWPALWCSMHTFVQKRKCARERARGARKKCVLNSNERAHRCRA